MIGIFFLAWLTTPELETTNLLETTEYLHIVKPSASKTCEDGSILLTTRNNIWHFSRDGKLIRKLGGRGEGPGQFLFIMDAIWDGRYYWVADGSRLLISRIDPSQVNEANTYYAFFESFVHSDSLFFGVGGINPQHQRKPSLGWILPIPNDEWLKKHNTKNIVDSRFHRLTDEVRNLKMNYTNHYVQVRGENIFVCNEINDKAFVYQRDSWRKLKEISLELFGFQTGPDEFMRPPYTRERLVAFENSFSRIQGFTLLENAMLVAYNGAQGEKSEPVMRLNKLNLDGRHLGRYDFDGVFLGGCGRKTFDLLVNRESEKGDPSYHLLTFRWD